MNQWSRTRLFLIVAGVVCLPLSAGEIDVLSDVNVVTEILVEASDDETVVRIEGSKAPSFTQFTLDNPPRLIIDMPSTMADVPDRFGGGGWVESIALESFSVQDAPLLRITVRLVEKRTYQIRADNHDLVVSLGEPSGQDLVARVDDERRTAEQERLEREKEDQRAREEAVRLAREEAARRAGEPVPTTTPEERLAREEEASLAREQAERAAREEADRLAREEALRAARGEAERQPRVEEDTEAREEERLAQEEAEKRAQEEADRRAQEEAERRAQEEAERRAQEEAERRAQEEAERRAQEEAERRAQEEAERRAQEEERRLARAEPAPPTRPARVRSSEAISGAPTIMSFLGFRPPDEKGVVRVIVETDRVANYIIDDRDPAVLLLKLENTRPRTPNDLNPLDTSFFKTAVEKVDVEEVVDDRYSIRILVHLRGDVHHRVRQDGNEISLELDSSS